MTLLHGGATNGLKSQTGPHLALAGHGAAALGVRPRPGADGATPPAVTCRRQQQGRSELQLTSTPQPPTGLPQCEQELNFEDTS